MPYSVILGKCPARPGFQKSSISQPERSTRRLLTPGVVQRHQAFIDAEQALGVTVRLAKFKRTRKGLQAKKTDVAIAVALPEASATTMRTACL